MFGLKNQPCSKAKACTQCGTTRTPQWREGAAGPKTLCNACGVKRQRQMGKLADGLKQKDKEEKQKDKEEKPAEVAPDLYQAQSLAAVAFATDNIQDNTTVPVRSARKRVTRTHDNGYLYYDELPRPTLKKMHFSDTNDSEQTDSGGEEMAWTPYANSISQEVNAAVDLLAMSIPAEIVAQAQTLNVLESLKAAESKAQASFAPAPLKDELARYGVELESLPADKVEVVMDAWVEAEKTRKEACAARHAVAGVAQVLAVKQAASIQARTSALLAAQRLRDMISALYSRTAPEAPAARAVPRRPRTTGKTKRAQLPEVKEVQQGMAEDVEMFPIEQTLQ